MLLVIKDQFEGRGGRNGRYVQLEDQTLSEILREQFSNWEGEDEDDDGNLIPGIESVPDDRLVAFCTEKWLSHECENFTLEIYSIVNDVLIPVLLLNVDSMWS